MSPVIHRRAQLHPTPNNSGSLQARAWAVLTPNLYLLKTFQEKKKIHEISSLTCLSSESSRYSGNHSSYDKPNHGPRLLITCSRQPAAHTGVSSKSLFCVEQTWALRGDRSSELARFSFPLRKQAQRPRNMSHVTWPEVGTQLNHSAVPAPT